MSRDDRELLLGLLGSAIIIGMLIYFTWLSVGAPGLTKP